MLEIGFLEETRFLNEAPIIYEFFMSLSIYLYAIYTLPV